MTGSNITTVTAPATTRPDPSGAARRAEPILKLENATLAFGDRTLWRALDLTVRPGEFIAVLGANGSGKSSLLKAIVGQVPLAEGSITLNGVRDAGGSRAVGYIPQHIAIDPITPVRAKDLVRLGIDGDRWGTGLFGGKAARARVDGLLAGVGVSHLATAPVQQLSGGELQRVRVAEALAGSPRLILADEVLSALDLAHAQRVVALIDDYRRETGAAVLFVTHDINAVLGAADRVLYFAAGSYRLGTPEEILTSETLSALYGAPVDVFEMNGRVVVAAQADPGADREDAHDHPAVDCDDPHGRQHLIVPGDTPAARTGMPGERNGSSDARTDAPTAHARTARADAPTTSSEHRP